MSMTGERRKALLLSWSMWTLAQPAEGLQQGKREYAGVHMWSTRSIGVARSGQELLRFMKMGEACAFVYA